MGMGLAFSPKIIIATIAIIIYRSVTKLYQLFVDWSDWVERERKKERQKEIEEIRKSVYGNRERDPNGEVEDTSHLNCEECSYSLVGLLVGAPEMPPGNMTRYFRRMEEYDRKVMAGEIDYRQEREHPPYPDRYAPVQREIIDCPECGYPNVLCRSEDNPQWH